MPVRLVSEVQVSIPQWKRELKMSPVAEIHVTKTGKSNMGTFIPLDTVWRRYGDNAWQAHMEVEKATFNGRIDPATFKLAFAPGTPVLDGLREINYTVGQSKQEIQSRLATVAKVDAFYNRLLGKDPPELHGAQWLVGGPIRLADIKQRKIILHFWNIGCGPCVFEIPRLQAQYGNTATDTDAPLFISIYSNCSGEDLAAARALLKEKSVTFPVMLDAPDPEMKSWGLTNKAYGINAIPQDAVVDENGRLISVGEHKLAQ